MRHDTANRRVDRTAADRSTGMHKVGRKRVLIHNAMIDRPHGCHVIHQLGCLSEMLGHSNAGNRGFDRGVVAA